MTPPKPPAIVRPSALSLSSESPLRGELAFGQGPSDHFLLLEDCCKIDLLGAFLSVLTGTLKVKKANFQKQKKEENIEEIGLILLLF